jgi:hypothetical protein
MADSPQQLIEGGRPLPSLEVFLDCVQLFDREDVASQKLPSKFPLLEFSRRFFQETLDNLEGFSCFREVSRNPR